MPHQPNVKQVNELNDYIIDVLTKLLRIQFATPKCSNTFLYFQTRKANHTLPRYWPTETIDKAVFQFDMLGSQLGTINAKFEQNFLFIQAFSYGDYKNANVLHINQA